MIKLPNHLRSALAVMNVGLMNRDGHREAKRVNHNVFLASFDFLVPVNALAGRVSMVGGLHASGGYDSHAGTLVPTYDFVSKGMQRIHDILKHAHQFPLPEVVIDCLPRAEFYWKKSPLTTCLIDVKNSIHDDAKRMFSCSYLRIDDIFDNLPLLISKVG